MSGYIEKFHAFPPNMRGALFVILGTAFFVLTDIVVKLTGERFHPVQMSIFRYASALSCSHRYLSAPGA